VLLLYLLYSRLAYYANVARYISTNLETTNGIGISQAYSDGVCPPPRKTELLTRLISIRLLVLFIASGLCAVLLISGISLP
jgi:hypothetical protein